MSGPTANYAPQAVNQLLTNLRIRVAAFGANGSAWIDRFNILGGFATLAGTLGPVTLTAVGNAVKSAVAAITLGPVSLSAVVAVEVSARLVAALSPVAAAGAGGFGGVLSRELEPVALNIRSFKLNPVPQPQDNWTLVA
jgi:hypothetical protein